MERLWDVFKLVMSWLGTIVSAITLSKILMFVTLVFTCLQIYVFWRDKVRKPPTRRRRE